MCLHLPLVPPAGTRSDHLYLRYHRVVERRRLGGLCRHVGLHHHPHLLHFLPDRHLLPAARAVDAHRKSRCLYRLVEGWYWRWWWFGGGIGCCFCVIIRPVLKKNCFRWSGRVSKKGASGDFFCFLIFANNLFFLQKWTIFS